MALNKVIVMGRLTTDPEMKTVGDDTYVTNFRIAVDRDFKNKDGDREADFLSMVAWRNLGEFVAKYFAKGDMIVVEGRLQSRTYQAEDGSNRNKVEIVASNCYFGTAKKTEQGASTAPAAHTNDDDGDLPF